jgi:hypothetical protein
MRELIASYPEVAAILTALIGLVLARLLSAASERGLDWLARSLRRLAPLRLETLDFETFKPVFRGAIYYFTLFVFLLLALRALSISVIGEWLDALALFVPQLILAAVIVLAGYLLGLAGRGAIAAALGSDTGQLLPRVVQWLVVTVAVLTGLGQLAVDISFVTNIIIILLTTFLGGLALAFALGSKQLVASVLARRGLERYRIGSRIRIDSIEGEIIEILDTAVVLESEGCISVIPAARFAATSVTILPAADAAEVGDEK